MNIRKSPKKTKAPSDEIRYRMDDFSVDPMFYKEDNDLSADNLKTFDGVTFQIKPTIGFLKEKGVIHIKIEYTLMKDSNPINSISSLTRFIITDFENLVFVKKVSESEFKILDFIHRLISISIGNTRGVHAIEIKKTHTPFLFMPVIDAKKLKIHFEESVREEYVPDK
ncbi:MAG: hypothetical protein V4590_04645 [Bacteroidota bacterium]